MNEQSKCRGHAANIPGRSTVRAGEILMPPYPLTNFKIQKYYQNEPKFNGFYSRNYLSKIKDGAYIINLDEYESIGSIWIALYINDDCFGVKQIPR